MPETQPWTRERRDRLLALCRAGESWSAIARLLCINHETAKARWLELSSRRDRDERERNLAPPAWRDVTPRQIAPIPAEVRFSDDPAAERDLGSAGRPVAPDRASWCGCAAAMTLKG